MLGNLGKIKVLKSSDLLADKLKAGILSNAFPQGTSLPTERELIATTGLSRGSVREALRMLEAQGLVETRSGRYGGSIVARPDDSLLASHITLYAKGRSVPLRSLVGVRLALEPMVALFAAQYRNDSDIAELQTIHARLAAASDNDVPAFLAENARWHAALAAASDNELLCVLSRSVADLLFQVSRIENFATPEIRSLVVSAYARILAAIKAGDGEAARRRTERHLQAYAGYLEAAVMASGRGTAIRLDGD